MGGFEFLKKHLDYNIFASIIVAIVGDTCATDVRINGGCDIAQGPGIVLLHGHYCIAEIIWVVLRDAVWIQYISISYDLVTCFSGSLDM